MPAIYTSYLFLPDDDAETKQRKLYLACISLGEDLYSFNAAMNEMRKTFDLIDRQHSEIMREYQKFKAAKQGKERG